MLENKILQKIPERSLAWLFCCLSGMLIFIFICILPRQHSLRAIEQEIGSLKEQVELQKILIPIYGTLKDRAGKQWATVLPYPRKSALQRERIAMLPAIMSDVADTAGMQTIQVSPELSTLNRSTNSLFVNVILRGDFMKFRNYLLGLGNLPFMERVEEINIELTPEGLEYRIRARLAVG